MNRSLTTWRHNMTGRRPCPGEDCDLSLEKKQSSHPFKREKGGLMAHKAHTSPAET
jgi:hypothetical protein